MVGEEMELKMVCKECGELAPIDTEKSTENWTVYKTRCEKCGGQTGIKID